MLSSPIVWTDDFDNGTDKHYCAFVTATYDEMVDLIVFPPGYGSPLPRAGVRHLRDPNREAIRNVNEGVWMSQEEHAYMKDREEALAKQQEADRKRR